MVADNGWYFNGFCHIQTQSKRLNEGEYKAAIRPSIYMPTLGGGWGSGGGGGGGGMATNYVYEHSIISD